MKEFIYSLFMEGHTIIGIICSLLYFAVPALVVFGAAAFIQKLIDEIKYKFFWIKQRGNKNENN